MEISKKDSHSDQELMKIYDLRNIAVVGMSNKEGKPGHFVPKYLIEHGYNVIPVNPTLKEGTWKNIISRHCLYTH